MKSGLFDSNGKEIKLGDKYIAHKNPERIYEVFFKGGAFCGGTSIDLCNPLGWYGDEDDDDEIRMDIDCSWLTIIE